MATETDNSTGLINVEKIIGLPPTDRKSVRVNKYDFKRPDKFTFDQIRTLHIMHETAARLMTTSLSAALRMHIDISVQSVDQLTFEEFIHSLPNPSCMMVLGMDPLNGHAVFEIDPVITFSVIDRVLGGNGDVPELQRDLTDMEDGLMRGLYEKALRKCLADAWSTVIPLSPVLRSIETNPMFTQIVPPTEMVILVSFNVKAGNMKGMINFCIPFLTIEPVLHKLTARYWYSSVRRSNTPVTATQAPDLKTDIELYYPTLPLSLSEIDSIAGGLPVRLDSYKDGCAVLDAGGIPVFELRRDNDTFMVLQGNDDTDELFLTDVKHQPSPAELITEQMGKFRDEISSIVSSIGIQVQMWQKQQEEFSEQLLSGFRDPETIRHADSESVKKAGMHRPFSFIRQENVNDLFLLVQFEYPQLTALVLSYLDPSISSRVLEKFNPELQIDIIRRISVLDRTAPEVIIELERYFEKKMKEMAVLQELYVAGGIQAAVEILSRSSRSMEKGIINALDTQHPELSEEIKKRLFVFEDIVMLDRKAVAGVIANSNFRDIAIALKVAPEEVKSFVLLCMNESEQTNLIKMVDDIGRVRLKDAEEAQQRIVNTIREMEESGLIIVARSGELIE